MAKEITLSMHSASLDSFADASGKVYWPYIKQYNITEEYYRYLKTSVYQDQIFEEGSIVTEPRTPKGNVKNGFGLFTVFAAVTDTIR
jgi:poly-beta-hydroxyalkanoate depolymerase